MEAYKFLFAHPSRTLISGPSGCGKTEFVKKVILYKNDMFTIVPKRILYTFKYEQSWFSEFPDVEFTKEVPTLLDPDEPSLVIIDDVACENVALKESASLFVRGSHHMNASVFFITQNLFVSSVDFRTISLNASQLVLFKTIRGLHQIEHLGRQIFGSKESRDFVKVYLDATKAPYSYLIVDLDPMQEHRLRTNVFPLEEEVVYLL
jgi:hypothetical protein